MPETLPEEFWLDRLCIAVTSVAKTKYLLTYGHLYMFVPQQSMLETVWIYDCCIMADIRLGVCNAGSLAACADFFHKQFFFFLCFQHRIFHFFNASGRANIKIDEKQDNCGPYAPGIHREFGY